MELALSRDGSLWTTATQKPDASHAGCLAGVCTPRRMHGFANMSGQMKIFLFLLHSFFIPRDIHVSSF